MREVLYYLAVFDCNAYNEKHHPVALFGRKEGIVRRFAEQAAGNNAGDSFKILISKAPEILRLRDLIEKRALELQVGRYKTGKGTRVRSATNRGNRLPFLNENVNGKIPLGWVCTAPGFLDTRLRYAAWRSSYCSRASSGVRYASFSRRQHWL